MDHSNYTVDFLIIGGGVAGLSAANRFADLCANALLVEASSFPMHKVCGEFISPEGLSILEDWGIFPQVYINKASFFLGNEHYSFSLPDNAGGLSRFYLDHALAQRTTKKNVPIITNKKVIQLSKEGNRYLATLSTGETIAATNILIGTGRIPMKDYQQTTTKLPYYGIKAHFSGIDLEDSLEMHLFPGAYLGISNVEKGIANIACIVKADLFKKYDSPEAFIDALLTDPKANKLRQRLSNAKMLFPEWLVTQAPEFSHRETPPWNNAYFIGDAAGSIPPATGNGLGMALTSGIMAADYAIKRDTKGFQQAWKKRYRSRIRWGKMLHKVFLSPTLSKVALKLCRSFPSLSSSLFKLTRE